MKRVNLIDYFELAEAINTASRITNLNAAKGIDLYVGTAGLPNRLRNFAIEDNGFSASKNVARELADTIDRWELVNLHTQEVPPQFKGDALNAEFASWSYSEIARKITAFRNVFEAECRDVDVYSVGQISLYRTSTLVSSASDAIPLSIKAVVGKNALDEFDSAGRCLAFSLYTACGFHSLRALELVMKEYLKSFGINKRLPNWTAYISAALKSAEKDGDHRKPSAKVTAMLDRMRELDRNPLMHPDDILDEVSADMLFRLSTITVVEIAKDMPSEEPAQAKESEFLKALGITTPLLPQEGA